jgi:hypothetical protein
MPTAELLGVLAALLTLAAAPAALGFGTLAFALGLRALTLTGLTGVVAAGCGASLTRALLILLSTLTTLVVRIALASFALAALTLLTAAIVSIRHWKPPLEELLFRRTAFSRNVPNRRTIRKQKNRASWARFCAHNPVSDLRARHSGEALQGARETLANGLLGIRTRRRLGRCLLICRRSPVDAVRVARPE